MHPAGATSVGTVFQRSGIWNRVTSLAFKHFEALRPTDTESGVPQRSELEPHTGLAERDGGAAERHQSHGRRLQVQTCLLADARTEKLCPCCSDGGY